MADERMEVSGSEMVRWVIIAVLVLAGLGAALWLGPETAPIAPPLEEADA